MWFSLLTRVIALYRGYRNALAIFMLNLPLGGSILGGVAARIQAYGRTIPSDESHREKFHRNIEEE